MGFPSTGTLNDIEVFQGKRYKCIKEPNIWNVIGIAYSLTLIKWDEYTNIEVNDNTIYIISENECDYANSSYLNNNIIHTKLELLIDEDLTVNTTAVLNAALSNPSNESLTMTIQRECGDGNYVDVAVDIPVVDSDVVINLPIFEAINGLPESTTFSRTSGAYHTQPDGSLVEVLPGELRIDGARRVENLLPNFPMWSQPDQVMHLGNGEYELDISSNLFALNVHTEIGVTVTAGCWLRCLAGESATIQLSDPHATETEKRLVYVTDTYQFFMWNPKITTTSSGFWVKHVAGATTVIGKQQVYTVGDASVISSYISPVTIYNSTVPGVKYFTTENGNTVDENGVVTEAVGAALSGPFSSLQEPNTTNLSAGSWVLLNNGQGVSPIFTESATNSRSIGLTSHRLSVDIQDGNTSSDYSLIRKSISGVVVGQVYTYSIYLRSDTNQQILMYLNDASGVTPNIMEVTAEWKKFSVTSTIQSATIYPTLGCWGVVTPPTSSDVFLCGEQVESGDTATSFTTSTRTADSAIEITLADLENENPQITYIDDNDNIVTEDVFGPELVVNGDFSDGTLGWEARNTVLSSDNTTLTVDDTLNAGGNSSGIQTITTKIGSRYLLVGTIDSTTTGGYFYVWSGEWSVVSPGDVLAISNMPAGEHSEMFTATSTESVLGLLTGGTGITVFDRILIREVHPLCSYDPDTDILSIGIDETTTRKVVKIK